MKRIFLTFCVALVCATSMWAKLYVEVPGQGTIQIPIDFPFYSVADVKSMIAESTNPSISVERQQLYYQSQLLSDNGDLMAYNIFGEGETLQLTILELPSERPLTFEAVVAGAQVSYTIASGDLPSVEYSTNESTWTAYSEPITLANVGDKVSFRANNSFYGGAKFGCTADCYIYGNIMSLVNAENFASATTLTGENTFSEMFQGNTHITNHPSKELVLPATTLTAGCYSSMFSGCTGLTSAPELPATTLAARCYVAMFSGCTGLTSTPALLATTLTEECYQEMFSGCTGLSSVVCSATGRTNTNATTNWLSGVAESGTFYAPEGSVFASDARGVSSIPTGWNIITNTFVPLTFEAMEAGAEVSFSGSAVEYSINDGEWVSYSSAISLANVGDKVSFRGNNASYSWKQFSCSADCYIYGNIMSLVDATGYPGATKLTKSNTFAHLFQNNTHIANHPSKDLVLPATTLTEYCYSYMFSDCSGLTRAPELPATTLAAHCYDEMFNSCTGITSAPILPATTLAEYCYVGMFWECTGLTSAPELPATTLARGCYNWMFRGCTGLTSAPELPATDLVEACYINMFRGCSNLSSVTCFATSRTDNGVTGSWLSGVAESGTFYAPTNGVLASDDRGANGIPTGWNIDIPRASVTSAPTAKAYLVYTGAAQALINAGTARGGEMQYSLDNSNWSTDIPTATETGDYTVYYKVVGDDMHADFKPAENSIAVTIKTTIYLVPGVWAADGAQFAAYVFEDGKTPAWSAIMMPTTDGKAYKADVYDYEKIIFVRLKNTAESANWEDKWNQTGNLTRAAANCYQITGWGEADGRWRNYPFYYVQFIDFDDTVLKTDTVDGGNAAAAPADPSRTGYTFTGWDAEYDNITSDLTITAQYEINKYTIVWKNEDGTTLETDENVEYGATPSYDGATPTKEATAQYTYTFDKWSPAIETVTGNATYTATYNSTVNQYTVIFYDEDGTTELKKQTLDYGATITPPSDPTKAATAQYTYTFNGWSPTFTPGTTVTGNASYTATYSSTVNQYTIIWENEDGTTLETDENVPYGATPSFDGETPTKDATAQYTYTFDKWAPAVASVTGNATYTATYSSTVNKYTVIFYDEDGTTELQKQTLDYGATITPPSDPTKAATAQYTYTFNGWSPTFTPGTTVTGNASYTATYSSTVNKYTIVWENEDGTTLETDENVPYGATPSFDGATPTKEATAQYTYTFDKWSPAIETVTGNATYTAQYAATPKSYTLAWNAAGGELSGEYTDGETAFGTTIVAPTATRTGYTFDAWTPEVPATMPAADATFTANWTEIKHDVAVEAGANGQVSVAKVENIGIATASDEITATANTGYHFVNWTLPDGVMLAEGYALTDATIQIHATADEKTITANFAVTAYTLTWVLDGGEVKTAGTEAGSVNYGTELTAPVVEKTGYTFIGWTPAVPETMPAEDVEFTAQWEINKYTIVWKNEDGSVLETDENVEYGATPAYNGETPTKAATAQYTYTFDKWSPAVAPVTGNATYTATFSATIRSYVITFNDEDGTVLSAEQWVYGSTPECDEPTKAADDSYTYTFAGWTPEIVSVAGEATYTATYDATEKPHDPTSLGDVQDDKVQCTKVLRGQHIYIIRSGETYDLTGQRVQ